MSAALVLAIVTGAFWILDIASPDLDLGIVRKFRDLFYLRDHRSAVMSMEGFGAKSFSNLQAAAEKARHTTPVRFLTALGIDGIGPATAKLICRHFGNDIDAIRNASAEEFTAIGGIGEVMADSLVRYFRDPANAAMLDDLVSVMDIRAEEGVRVPQSLEGKTVVITGSLLHFPNREALQAQIEAHGGKTAEKVKAYGNRRKLRGKAGGYYAARLFGQKLN